ncbi:MAG: hypothetical protein NVSMB52_21210 [Chloroflexota bacterium]
MKGPTIPGAPRCPIFPTSNVWNRDISGLPVAVQSSHLIRSIGLNRGLHPDFGQGPDNGIPFGVVGHKQKKTRIHFDYADESDNVPYPIRAHPLIEAGSDHHLLVVDRDTCQLYELFAAERTSKGWRAGSGAVWNLNSNKLRRDGWTSADAAGLPILPGLVRYDEVLHGAIHHALRFSARVTRKSHIYPARHDAGKSGSVNLAPMGLRVRLKASIDLSGFSHTNRVILTALKKYGMLLADNGSSWFVTGAPHPRWNDDDLHKLNRIKGSDFEVVDTSRLRNGP